MIDLQRFEELVDEAIHQIPDELWDVIENVDVVIQDWPSSSQLSAADLPRGSLLLGLYEGIPLTERTSHYGLVLPDKITIFRRPILAVCPPSDPDAVRAQVRRTVLHEIAHHFGISDDRLREIGAY